ncbi:MAG: SAM-dependent methyltransferase [Bacteroidales bacterium]|nr:SAM-dependent methyltransferase [Bacteroidales bacterium]
MSDIDYWNLPISDYSRKYILRMLPNIDYYLEIYRDCLIQMLRQTGKPPSDITMVDYGGGHGFLSFTAKAMGIGRVVYIDINPQAVETVKALSEELGDAPDDVLQGDAGVLRQWCGDNQVVPDALLGMDVIEHIYRLEDFFADTYAVNPNIFMLFTTGSTPYNPRVVRRLRSVMQADELGHAGQPGFFQLRKNYILEHYPDMKDWEAELWAADTRGLTYPDILVAIDTHAPNTHVDAYNTCDPATGSWTERILPIAAYRSVVEPYHGTVSVRLGHYNTHRRGFKRLLSVMLNWLLRIPFFRPLAPFIILKIST